MQASGHGRQHRPGVARRFIYDICQVHLSAPQAHRLQPHLLGAGDALHPRVLQLRESAHKSTMTTRAGRMARHHCKTNCKRLDGPALLPAQGPGSAQAAPPAPPHTTVRKVATPHNPISKLEGLPPFETPPSGPARHCHRPPWQAPPLLCLSPHAVRPSKNNQAASGARRKCRLYTAGIPSTITCFLVSGDPGLSPLPIMCKCNKPPTHGPLHLSGVCSLTTCGHKCMRPLGSVAVLSGPYADGQTRGRLTGGGAGVVMRWRSWGHR